MDGTRIDQCDCDNCQKGRAALALQAGGINWLDLAAHDAELQSVVHAWAVMPEAIRRAVTALIGTVELPTERVSLAKADGQVQLQVTAKQLAQECRNIVQGYLREEEWQDVDWEFYNVIIGGFVQLAAISTPSDATPAG